jgi:hypothetical protein
MVGDKSWPWYSKLRRLSYTTLGRILVLGGRTIWHTIMALYGLVIGFGRIMTGNTAVSGKRLMAASCGLRQPGGRFLRSYRRKDERRKEEREIFTDIFLCNT